MKAADSQQELQRTLDSTFGPHLQAVCQRSSEALASCGYTGLLVYAGSLLPVFEDDRTYPFEANAPFKVWVPLSDAPGSFVWFTPGSTPKLIVERPQDYWYKPPSLPQGYWVRHFDVHTVADRAEPAGLAQTHELVGGLRGADIVQSVQQRPRIDGPDAEVVESFEGLTDVGGA